MTPALMVMLLIFGIGFLFALPSMYIYYKTEGKVKTLEEWQDWKEKHKDE